MAFTAAVRLPLPLPLPLSPPASSPSLRRPKPAGALLPAPRRPSSARLLSPPSSLGVSQDDKAASEPQGPEEERREGAAAALDQRRLEESFVVLNTGVFECGSCGHRYDRAVGDPSYPIPPGLGFEDLPEDWRCPTCGAARSFFVSKSVEIAGFAQNQQFGLGGNTLTGGQKATLIYGSLLFFFALFLSGYFLQ